MSTLRNSSSKATSSKAVKASHSTKPTKAATISALTAKIASMKLNVKATVGGYVYNMLPSIRNCSSSQAVAKVGGGSQEIFEITVTMSAYNTEWTRRMEYRVPSGTTYEDVMKLYLAEPTHGIEFREVKKFTKAELYAICEDGDIINPLDPDDAEAHPLRELAIRVHSDPVNNIKSPIQTSGQLLHFTVLLPRAEVSQAEVSQAEAKAGASYECPVDMTTDDDDVPTGNILVEAFYEYHGSFKNWRRQPFNVLPGTTAQELADKYMRLPVHNDDLFKGHFITEMICRTATLCDLDNEGCVVGKLRDVSMTDGINGNGQLLRLFVGPRVQVKVEATYVCSNFKFKTIDWEQVVPLGSTLGAVIELYTKAHPTKSRMHPLFSYQIDGYAAVISDVHEIIEYDGTLILNFL